MIKEVSSKVKKLCKMSEYSLKRFINKTMKLEPQIRKYRLLEKLPNYLNEVLIGVLLSDGSIERPSKTGGARFSVVMGKSTLPYIEYLFTLFRPFIDSGLSYIDVKNKNSSKEEFDPKIYTTVRFKTVMLPLLVNYHNLFYAAVENSQRYVKIIPETIESLMTPVVLAHLIMGDGNLQKNNGIIRIYTNSFTKLEVEMLARAISNKLGIITRVVHDRNDQYMLCISRSQLDKVITQLEGHMHPSMLYKLGITNNSFDIEKILAQVR